MNLGNIAALFSGGLFSVGLVLSQMVEPRKVQGFLDITGQWDPALLLVMATALIVYWICYFIVKPRLDKPLLAESFSIPTCQTVDKKLIFGSILFGLGWGLTGLCPGPVIASLSSGDLYILVFFTTMLLTIFTFELIMQQRE